MKVHTIIWIYIYIFKLRGITTQQKVLFCKRMASWFRQHSNILKSIWYYRYRKWWANNTINSPLSSSCFGDSTLTGPCSENCVINSYFHAKMLYSKKNIIIRKTSISEWKYIHQSLRPGENTVKYFLSIWITHFNLIIEASASIRNVTRSICDIRLMCSRKYIPKNKLYQRHIGQTWMMMQMIWRIKLTSGLIIHHTRAI